MIVYENRDVFRKVGESHESQYSAGIDDWIAREVCHGHRTHMYSAYFHTYVFYARDSA